MKKSRGTKPVPEGARRTGKQEDGGFCRDACVIIHQLLLATTSLLVPDHVAWITLLTLPPHLSFSATYAQPADEWMTPQAQSGGPTHQREGCGFGPVILLPRFEGSLIWRRVLLHYSSLHDSHSHPTHHFVVFPSRVTALLISQFPQIPFSPSVFSLFNHLGFSLAKCEWVDAGLN